MSKKTINLIKVGIAIVVLPPWILVGYWFLSVITYSFRQSTQYIIPSGYVGWIRVEYEVKGTPPLPQKDGYAIAKIPSSGLLRTSSKTGSEGIRNVFYYLTPTGERQTLIKAPPGGIGKIHTYRKGKKSEDHFVGSQEQLQKFGWGNTGRPGLLKVQ